MHRRRQEDSSNNTAKPDTLEGQASLSSSLALAILHASIRGDFGEHPGWHCSIGSSAAHETEGMHPEVQVPALGSG